MIVKSGQYAGQPVQFSDGPVSEALGWNSFGEMMRDGRPVVIDLISRMSRDHPDREEYSTLMTDVENLEYIHIAHGGGMSLGHVFHKSELGE